MNRTRLLLFLFSLLFFGCGPSVKLAPPPPPLPPPPSPPSCETSPKTEPSSVYAVFVDVSDVGREVRTTSLSSGPFGEERLRTSHLFKRVGFNTFEYDNTIVRTELTSARDGSLLRASYSVTDSIKGCMVAEAGFDGSGWQRVKERRSSATDPPRTEPSNLDLFADVVIGLDVFNLLARIASGEVPAPYSFYLYNPWLDAPVRLIASKPEHGFEAIDNSSVHGAWVSLHRDDGDRLFLQSFIDDTGRSIIEIYPAVHQKRVLVESFLPLPSDRANANSGRLFSSSYVGLIHRVSHAIFSLKSVTALDRDSFTFLNDPSNQKLTRISDTELRLTVSPGTPDDGLRPTDDDTSGDDLVLPSSPEIKGACRLLRSGGSAGSLNPERKKNASAVLSKSALIRNPGSFWKDNDKVAKLVMEYVYSLIPSKVHLPGMVDANTILARGSGDCREHSILFASIMRSFGIPTRLVSGMFLSHGGSWEPHLWAIYWDGHRWRQIDPANNEVDPGALYISFGRASYTFKELRSDVSSFLDSSFSGVSFDLTEASAEGEKMHLARPRNPGFSGMDSSVFNAAILSSRGDDVSALSVLDESFDDISSTVDARLFRAELLVSAGRYEEALSSIEGLRRITSSPANTGTLDILELKATIAIGKLDRASAVLDELDDDFPDDSPEIFILRASLLQADGRVDEALDLLSNALSLNPRSPRLVAAQARLLTSVDTVSREDLLLALARLDKCLFTSLYSDAELLLAKAEVLLSLGLYTDALSSARMGLTLRPRDGALSLARDTALKRLSSCP